MDLSSDGALIALGGNRFVRVIDADSGAFLWSLQTGQRGARQVAFSPDGAMLLGVLSQPPGDDDSLRFWSLEDGEQRDLLPQMTSQVHFAAWSPDGTHVLTGHQDGLARLWDLTAGALAQTFTGHEDSISAVAFSPDGARILSASYDHTARVWDIATGQEVLQYEGHAGRLSAASFSPNGQLAATAANGSVHVWDAITGEQVKVLSMQTMLFGLAEELSWSPDGQRLSTSAGNFEGVVTLWNVETGVRPFTFDLMFDAMYPVISRILPDNQTLVTVSSFGQQLAWWDIATGERLRDVRGFPHGFQTTTMTYAPDGASILAAGMVDSSHFEPPFFQWQDYAVRVWDTATATNIHTLQGHGTRVETAVFTPDRTQIFTGSFDRTIRVWDADTGDLLDVFEGFAEGIRRIVFSPDGSRIAVGFYNDSFSVFDAHTTELAFTAPAGFIVDMAYTADGNGILLSESIPQGSSMDAARLRDAHSGEVIRVYGEGLVPSPFVIPTPDGAAILTAADTTATLWDIETGEVIREFPGHEHPIGAAAITPDGRYIVTGTLHQWWDRPRRNRALHVWDIDTGEEVRQFTVFPVNAIAISPDGERFTAALQTNSMPEILEWDISDINPYQVGDVNYDGVTNAVDVQLVINAALGLELPLGVRADRNFNGLVNAVDVQLVINAALGVEK